MLHFYGFLQQVATFKFNVQTVYMNKRSIRRVTLVCISSEEYYMYSTLKTIDRLWLFQQRLSDDVHTF